MSPRTGRPPSESPRDKGYRVRMTDGDKEKLEYAAKVLGLTQAEVIRQGIEQMYMEAQKKAQK